MNSKINVGIVGAAGYTGGELIRILVHHPYVQIQSVLSRTNFNKEVSSIHTDLIGDTNLIFTDQIAPKLDVLFLCLPHNESSVWLEKNTLDPTTKVIDLGNDFRLSGDFKNGTFVYGLPEVNLESIKNSQFIANPGCFATAIQLALLPLAKEKMLKTVNTNGITGSTGAGVQLQPTSHFSWRSNNISAYKTLNHQHVPEICKTLDFLNSRKVNLKFVPWRGDFTRGIYTSSTIKTDVAFETIKTIYQNYYENNPFVFVSSKTIDLKQVVNTNKCLIFLEKEKNYLVVHSIIDNLVKGAAGQAIQNMNLMFNLPETTGLKLKATAF